MFKNYKLFALYCLILIAVFSLNCSNDSIITNPGSSSSPLSAIDAKYAMDWMDLEYRIIADQHNDQPPPPSRLFSYTMVAIYECVAPGIPFSRSLSGQLISMPPMPKVNNSLEYDWPLVIDAAMPLIINGIHDTLFPNSVGLINQKYNSILQERSGLVSQEVIDRSLQQGIAIADKILEWASTDGYEQTRHMHYVPPPRSQDPQNWVPVNPGDTACEPYWGTIRPFICPNAQTFYNIPHPPFNTSSGQFYQEAMELVNISRHLTQEQKRIAVFWNDKLRTGTPAGHWVEIINQVARIKNLRLDGIAKAYALMGPTISDGFKVCWAAKYRYNLLRPQTYIQDYIDPNWFPYLLNPSFPAYPSGHSNLSGACAEVMKHIFGDVPFTDHTHDQLNLQPRSFNTFNEVAEEAAFSRLYGGIHYRSDSENGLAGGHELGRYIINHISLSMIP